MEIKKLGNPVAILNQLITCINYHHKVVSNPPAVIQVTAEIRDQTFEAEGNFLYLKFIYSTIDIFNKSF